jgi:hypothetical protein
MFHTSFMTGGYAMLFLDQAPIFFADKMPWQVPVQGEVVEAFAQGGDTCFNLVCL